MDLGIDSLFGIGPRLANFEPEEGLDCSNNFSCSDLHLDHWDRPTCVARIMARQRLDPHFADEYGTSKYFGWLNDTHLANTSDNMAVTRLGCHEFCGAPSFYWDAVPRVTTWVIPVVLLLSNIELSPIDKRRFTTIIHAVGDPIDSFWSILHKMYVWRRLYAIAMIRCLEKVDKELGWPTSREMWMRRFRLRLTAWKCWFIMWYRRLGRLFGWIARRIWPGADANGQYQAAPDDDEVEVEDDYDEPYERARVIATVLAGFEEIGGSETASELHYMMVMDRLGHVGRKEESEAAWKQWRKCARRLADARTNELPRTLLAIFIYIFTVAAALDDDIGGGNTSKPGGRIGSAVFLMWLIPLTLLSNTVGAFTSRRTCLDIMHRFARRTREDMELESRRQRFPGQTDAAERRGSPSPTRSPRQPQPQQQVLNHTSAAEPHGLSPPINLPSQLSPQAEGSPRRPFQHDPFATVKRKPVRLGSSNVSPADRQSPSPRIRRKPVSLASIDIGPAMMSTDDRLPLAPRPTHPRAASEDDGMPSSSSIRAATPGMLLNVNHAPRQNRSYSDGSLAAPQHQRHRFVHFTESMRGGVTPGTDIALEDVSRSPSHHSAETSRMNSPSGIGGTNPRGSRIETVPEIDVTQFDTRPPVALGHENPPPPPSVGSVSSHGGDPSEPLLKDTWSTQAVEGSAGRFEGTRGRHMASPQGMFAPVEGPEGTREQYMASPPDMNLPAGSPGETREQYVALPQADPDLDPHRVVEKVPLIPETSWKHYFAWMQPLGAIYTYRPWKLRYRSVSVKTHARYAPNWLLFVLGVFPVFVSAIGGFVIMWYAVPIGWSCRHAWVVGVTVLWLFSVAITTLLHSLESIELSGATLWTLVIIKDSIIGLAALALVFLSTSGLFNSCYCWSTYMWHRWIPGDWGDKAYVQLTTSDLYDEWARKVYSPVVYGSLGLQVIYFFFVLILWWDGIYVVRWNEHRCRSEWHHEVGHGSPRIEYDESNYLVFWYDKHDITQLETIRVRRNSRFVTERRSSRPQVGSDVLRALRRSTGNF